MMGINGLRLLAIIFFRRKKAPDKMFKPITINYLRLEFFSTPGVQESRKRKTALLQRDSGILLALNL